MRTIFFFLISLLMTLLSVSATDPFSPEEKDAIATHVKAYYKQTPKVEEVCPTSYWPEKISDARVASCSLHVYKHAAKRFSQCMANASTTNHKAAIAIGIAFLSQARGRLKDNLDLVYHRLGKKNLAIRLKQRQSATEIDMREIAFSKYPILLAIASHLDDQTLLKSKGINKTFYLFGELAFSDRSPIKTPLASFKEHSCKKAVSYFIRKNLWEIARLLSLPTSHMEGDNNSSKARQHEILKKAPLYKKYAQFCRRWGYPGAALFSAMCNTYPDSHAERLASLCADQWLILMQKNVYALPYRMGLVSLCNISFEAVRENEVNKNPSTTVDIDELILFHYTACFLDAPELSTQSIGEIEKSAKRLTLSGNTKISGYYLKNYQEFLKNQKNF